MSNPAETYEREMVPALFDPWVPLLLDVAGPRLGERVLDLACGTGVVARRVEPLLGPGGRVAGLDLSPAMLAVARRAAEREDARVDWCQGRAEALPFCDACFDLALCQQGLQFVPEKPRALAEMHRVLTGGGRVALSVWRGLDHHPFFARFDEVLARHLGIPALSSPFALGDGDELRALLAGAGFRDVAIEPHSLTARFPDPRGFVVMEVDVLAAAVPAVQHLDAQARKALAEAIGEEMSAPVQELTRDGHLVIPMHAYVVRAGRPPA